VVILLVGLEVLGQLFDAGGQQGDLHFRGAGIAVAALVFVDDFLGIDGHGCLVVAWPAGTEGRSLARTARLAVMEWKREMRPCEQRDYSPHRQPQAMRAVKRSGLAVFAAGAHRRPAE